MRRLILPLLLIGALAAAGVALWLDGEADPGTATSPSAPATLRVPFLTPRRVPALVIGPAADAELAVALGALAADSPPASCLVVRRDGHAVYTHRPDQWMLPASTQKIFTASAALDQLGANTTWLTFAGSVAALDADGLLDGDLWLIGGGDPTLQTADYTARFDAARVDTPLEAMADDLVASGLTRVRGAVIGDETRYDPIRAVDSWPDGLVATNRAGPLSALMVDGGFTSYPTDTPDDATATPAPDPASSAAAILDDLLEARGVVIDRSPRSGTGPDGLHELAATESQPLETVITDMNAFSDNTTAELLVKELGFRLAGDGSTAAGTAALTEALTELGHPTVSVADGSGLSRQNITTCNALVATLDAAGPDSPLAASLAVSGAPGTLQQRFVGQQTAGPIRAKTGSLNDVEALAGFATGHTGEDLSFVFLINEPELDRAAARALQDRLVAALVAWPAGIDPAEVGPAS